MTEWEQPPRKPDFRVVVDGTSTPLYRDMDGYLRPNGRDLTLGEVEVLRALGQPVSVLERLQAENKMLYEQLARNTVQSAMIRYDSDDYIRRASVALEDAEKKMSTTWRFIALVVIFAWSAITFGQMAGWLP